LYTNQMYACILGYMYFALLQSLDWFVSIDVLCTLNNGGIIIVL
jgi:hypothetical protein